MVYLQFKLKTFYTFKWSVTAINGRLFILIILLMLFRKSIIRIINHNNKNYSILWQGRQVAPVFSKFFCDDVRIQREIICNFIYLIINRRTSQIPTELYNDGVMSK